MGKVAFVFPGQGSQAVGMGKHAYDTEPRAREVFGAADAALGEPLSELCFSGPEEALKLTANTQPCLLTVSVALLRAFGETPDVVAGHSLGEYSANVAAGSLSFERAVRLVRVRGLYMQEAVPFGVGAMAAVLGGDLAAIEEVLRVTPGSVQPVNYNSPGQLVIAGEAVAVEAAKPALVALGCRVVPLPVSAPFHSRLMQPAEVRLEPHLRDTPFHDTTIPIYTNLDAKPTQQGAAARDALIQQVSRPVHWQASIERMRDDGVTLFVEIGPGKVLSGLIKRIDKQLAFVNVQTPADFEAARAAIGQARTS
ncbi:MAG: Malonyl CoA-acyl carrier protein transacylase [Myxococcaceae bacterium]|nr:Malonyl CoA-acyl carrier protein transacylase [Myxococcaceae bacterium]